MKRIRKGDLVKILIGDKSKKGKIATVAKIDGDKVFLEKIGLRDRHYKATALSPAGKREIQIPVHISNVALVVDATAGKEKTSRVKYEIKDDKKVRVAKINNQEVK